MRRIELLILLLALLSCSRVSRMDWVLELAGSTRAELEAVLEHYRLEGDERKLEAAEFLITNMGYNKYSYDGEILQHYDTIFHLYASVREQGVHTGDPPIVTEAWAELVKEHGLIDLKHLQKVYDYETLRADFLISNIEQAFQVWERSPLYNPGQFDLFCEYILPYRMMHEPVEEYRQDYLESYFLKSKEEAGWVGLDLGVGNERIVTRIRFCPRSDTNFILQGDEYELLYWDKNKFQSMGRKIALQYNYIDYNNVPSGAMYLLRNHSRGKEERIFTYQNGEQVWW